MEEVSGPKKNPLIRASSEESSSDPNCCSSPGDTLPWNLPKHHRMKRSKSASGDVLDPAERAVIRIAGMKLLLRPQPRGVWQVLVSLVSWASSEFLERFWM